MSAYSNSTEALATMINTSGTGIFSRREHSTESVSTNSSFWNSTQVMVVPEGCVVLHFSGFLPWDNPDNLISQETQHIIDIIVNIGFLNVLYFISAPINILNMMVFTKQGLKERINLCLFFQSLADLIYMTMAFLLYFGRIYTEVTQTTNYGLLSLFILDNYLLGFLAFHAASGFMTMVIATERCFCVLSPLRAQRILQTRSMLVILLLAFLIIVGGFFPVGTRWGTACVFDPKTRSVSSAVLPSKFYLQHKTLIDTLDVYVYGIILPGTFTFVVGVSTLTTVIKLKKMTSWREKTSSKVTSVRDVALTRMLIGISLLFIVCTLPQETARIWIVFIPDFSLGGRYHNTFNVLFNFGGLLGFVNSSFNFFVYYSLGTKYRETLDSLCGRQTTKGRKNSTGKVETKDNNINHK